MTTVAQWTLASNPQVDSKDAMRGSGYLDRLTSIVAIDLRGAIGCRNELPWKLKTDMAFFKSQTIGNTVVMGRKTYDSLGGKPLPRRNNVVISHNNVLFPSSPHCQLALSIDEALFLAASFNDDEAYVIGGAQTYGQFDEIVDRYLLTVVDHEVPDADAFLSDEVLASIRKWDRDEIARHCSEAGVNDFAFAIYELTAPNCDERKRARNKRIAAFREKIGSAKRSSPRRSVGVKMSQDAFAFLN